MKQLLTIYLSVVKGQNYFELLTDHKYLIIPYIWTYSASIKLTFRQYNALAVHIALTGINFPNPS